MTRRFEKYASVSHLEKGLHGSAVRGGVWTLSAQMVSLVLQIASTAVLARLLLPDDFGLVALVASFIGVILIVKDAGFAQAVVQQGDIDHAQISTLFWLNLALSVVVAALCAAAAPLMVLLYHRWELMAITLAMAVAAFAGSFGGIHRALMQRQMRLRSLSIAQIAALAGSILVAVVMAKAGYGYWSLVGMQLARVWIDTAWVLAACRWIPGAPSRRAGAGGMARSGGYMIGHSLIAYGGRNLDNLLVGGWLGTAMLGQYTRAYGLLLMPVQQVTAPIGRVAVPTLSRLVTSDPARYRRTYARLVMLMAMVTMPGIAALMASAEPLIEVLLGPGWTLVAPTFQWLGLAAIAQPITGTLSWLTLAEGRSKEQFWYSTLYFALLLACFLAATPFGIVALAAAYGVTGILLRSPLGVWLVLRKSPVGVAAFYRAIVPGLAAGIASFVAGTLATNAVPHASHPIRLTLGLCTSALAVGLCYALISPWRNAILHTRSWLKELRPGRPRPTRPPTPPPQPQPARSAGG